MCHDVDLSELVNKKENIVKFRELVKLICETLNIKEYSIKLQDIWSILINYIIIIQFIKENLLENVTITLVVWNLKHE